MCMTFLMGNVGGQAQQPCMSFDPLPKAKYAKSKLFGSSFRTPRTAVEERDCKGRGRSVAEVMGLKLDMGITTIFMKSPEIMTRS